MTAACQLLRPRLIHQYSTGQNVRLSHRLTQQGRCLFVRSIGTFRKRSSEDLLRVKRSHARMCHFQRGSVKVQFPLHPRAIHPSQRVQILGHSSQEIQRGMFLPTCQAPSRCPIEPISMVQTHQLVSKTSCCCLTSLGSK